MRVIFFGTPQFAVPSLRALAGEGFDVAAVVTQPDRPQGRSRSESVPPPVKIAALDEGIPILQPERPSVPEFIETLRTLTPDIGVVVGYGHILKTDLLDLPPRGMLNVHASLLPDLRGAAPIAHAILGGRTETGISIMRMEAGLDTGPVLHRVATPIAPDETAGELTVRLSELGALALIEALALLESGDVHPEPQDHSRATYAPKVTRELARLHWDGNADAVARHIRAFDPKPGAWSVLHDAEIKVFGPRPFDDPGPEGEPGTVIQTDPAFVVAAGEGALQILDVQPAGKQRLAATDWIRGRGAKVGDRFE